MVRQIVIVAVVGGAIGALIGQHKGFSTDSKRR